MNHWIYALPGTHLEGWRSAGAPRLEELATMVNQESDLWRSWILYGSPSQALAELASTPGLQNQADAIHRWRQDLLLAAQIKRRWRHQVVVLHLADRHCSSESKAAWERLERELPELELQARLERRAQQLALMPESLTKMAACFLMQTDSGLLQAYLDLEQWADQPSASEEQALWRSTPSHSHVLGALSTVKDWGKTSQQNQYQIDQLSRQLMQLGEERRLLEQNLQQLESELDHYYREHMQLSTVTTKLEEQLLRARRLLGFTPAPTLAQ